MTQVKKLDSPKNKRSSLDVPCCGVVGTCIAGEAILEDDLGLRGSCAAQVKLGASVAALVNGFRALRRYLSSIESAHPSNKEWKSHELPAPPRRQHLTGGLAGLAVPTGLHIHHITADAAQVAFLARLPGAESCTRLFRTYVWRSRHADVLANWSLAELRWQSCVQGEAASSDPDVVRSPSDVYADTYSHEKGVVVRRSLLN